MRRSAKWGMGLAIAAVIGMAAAYIGRQQIGATLFARGADARAGRDITAGMSDGLHLFLCGTGSPLPSATRAGPCAVVVAGRRIYVVDIGEGGARNMALAGFPMGRIDGLFLTHFHSDHFDGIGPLLLMRWTQASAQAPLPVYGPEGVAALVDGMHAAYATDDGYRVAHHGPAIVPPGGAGGRALPFAVPPEDGSPVTVLDRDGLVVTAFRVDHGPVRPAVGYRFSYKGRSIVISGDTAPTPAMARNARGADILLHEALQPTMVAELTRALTARGQNNVAQITRDIINYHTTPADAARAAQAAGVRQLVLTHVVPAPPSALFYPAFLGDAARHFSGPITVGEDGMLFHLPARSQTIVAQDAL